MPEYVHTETVAKQAREEAAGEVGGKAKKTQQLQANRAVSNKYCTGLTHKRKDASQERKSEANKSHFDLTDCTDHEEIIPGGMRISPEKEPKLRMMMGDDTLARMINKNG